MILPDQENNVKDPCSPEGSFHWINFNTIFPKQQPFYRCVPDFPLARDNEEPSVNYAQPEDKSSMNSKNETFLVPHSALQVHLLAVYVGLNLYLSTENAQKVTLK